MFSRYRNRKDAGQRLATRVGHHAGEPGLLVLGLPRGGVPVAYEVARALGAPLDVYIVRKLGVPGYAELAMGAIAPFGTRVLNGGVIDALHIPPAMVEAVARREAEEIARRERAYREGRPAPAVAGRPVIVVDDGLATGSSMRAALVALRQQGAGPIVAAAPVGAPDSCVDLGDEADEVICAETPDPFYAVSLWYEDFPEVTDGELRELLARAAREQPQPAAELGPAHPRG